MSRPERSVRLVVLVAPGLPEELTAIAVAKQQLSHGQILIVSVMGSPDATNDAAEMVDQFAYTAEHARDAGGTSRPL